MSAALTTSPSPAAPPGAAVVGDGTTAASRARTRWHRARGPLAIVLVVLVIGALTALLPARTSAVPLAPDNPGAGGARAVAEILREQGVAIDFVRTVNQATSRATEGTTLLVAGTGPLWGEQIDELTATRADLVVVGPAAYDVPAWSSGTMRSGFGGQSGTTTRAAACSDPDASAAVRIASGATGVRSTGDAVICFPTQPQTHDEDRAGIYGIHEDAGRRVVLITDASLMTNAALADGGNAALMLRALGHHERLIWLVPSWDDTGLDTPPQPGFDERLPDWLLVLAVQLIIVVVAVGVWQGRRMGRLVVEPLPVTVRAAETTLGRGRLYRRSRSRGHAAAALRAGAARRAASRLGLPRSAGARDVIDALAAATSLTTEQVAHLLYGPPPTDDAGLLDLARALDQLESEVHRT